MTDKSDTFCTIKFPDDTMCDALEYYLMHVVLKREVSVTSVKFNSADRNYSDSGYFAVIEFKKGSEK